MVTRRKFGLLTTAASMFGWGARAATPIPVALYKKPSCACCQGYAEYLDRHGFVVTVHETDDLAGVSRKAGIPADKQGCHTSFIGDYVVDGHVPVATIRKLLDGRPAIVGITLPGMPGGVPGMDGTKEGPLAIYAIARDGTASTFDTI